MKALRNKRNGTKLIAILSKFVNRINRKKAIMQCKKSNFGSNLGPHFGKRWNIVNSKR